MWKRNRLTQLLGIEYPIIQAGMAGGPTTPALVAAVSNAGGLGTLGAGYLSPEQIRASIREIRRLTDRPFAVNLLIPEPTEPHLDRIERMNTLLNVYRKELGIPIPSSLPRWSESFEEQLAVVLEEQVPVFSFTFGLPSAKQLEALKRNRTVVIGTATRCVKRNYCRPTA
jgi:nitronate monooxygenase